MIRQPCAEPGLVSAVDDGEIQPRQPLGKRRAERSGRHQPAIADAEAAVKDPDGHAVRQIGVLHAVIHQDHVMRAALGNDARAARPVTRD